METVKQIGAILLLSTILGVVYNSVQPFPVKLFRDQNSPVLNREKADDPIERIHLARLQILLSENRIFLLDARSDELFRESHLPGAVHLDPDNFEARSASLEAMLKSAEFLVTYDDGGASGRALRLAERLSAGSDHRVRLFEGGMEAWTASGMPVEKGLWQ